MSINKRRRKESNYRKFHARIQTILSGMQKIRRSEVSDIVDKRKSSNLLLRIVRNEIDNSNPKVYEPNWFVRLPEFKLC